MAAPFVVLLRDRGGRGVGARAVALRRANGGGGLSAVSSATSFGASSAAAATSTNSTSNATATTSSSSSSSLFPPASGVATPIPATGSTDDAVLLWEGTQFSTPHVRSFDEKGFYTLVAEVYGCLGVLPVRKEVYAAFVTDVAPAGSIEGQTVYRVTAVRFVALTTNQFDNAPPGYAERGEYILPSTGSATAHPCADAQKYFAAGMFYFAPFVDLTSNAQRRALVEDAAAALAAAEERGPLPTASGDLPRSPWATVDMRFLWNRYMLKDMLRVLPRASPSSFAWPPLVLAIQGFFASEGYAVGRSKFNVALISRVSPARTGTRFNVRGVDDDGHCANFVETEQLVYGPEGTCLAVTQVRGSVPLFWEQDGVQIGGHRVDFSRHVLASAPALRRHFDDLTLRYGPVRVVSLLSQRGGEQPLADAYRRALTALGSPLVRQTAFDFHQQCRDSFEALSMLVGEMSKDIRAFGFFERHPSGRTVAKQEGIFRVNCLDCLDRTNMVQTEFAKAILDRQLQGRQWGLRAAELFNARLKDMWANNGDNLSMLYTGSGALNSEYARTGKRTLVGRLDDVMRSMNRMYNNAFLDEAKQDLIDLLLGRTTVAQASTALLQHPIADAVDDAIRSRAGEWQSKKTVFLHLGTWNVNARRPSNESVLPWLTFDSGESPDIFALSFQEIVELSAKQVMNTDESTRLVWEEQIELALNADRKTKGQYILLRSEQLVGAALFVFCKSEHVDRITNVEAHICKTGFSGVAGNKGGVAIRLDYDSTSLCFVNAHLAAGQSHIDERCRDYQTIMEGIQFSLGRRISHHDAVFWLGDFNYRLDMPNDEVRACCAAGNISAMLAFDQLRLVQEKGLAFVGMIEPEISFLPTYKYDNGTNNYDTSEKMRTPAWCDRILYKGDQVSPWLYGRSELLVSDHKPVKALMDVQVVAINSAVHNHIRHEVHKMLPGIPVFAEDPLRPLLLADLERRSAALKAGAATGSSAATSSGPLSRLLSAGTAAPSTDFGVPPATPQRPASMVAATAVAPPPTPAAAAAPLTAVLIDLSSPATAPPPTPARAPAPAAGLTASPAAPILWESEDLTDGLDFDAPLAPVPASLAPPALPSKARPGSFNGALPMVTTMTLLEPMRADQPAPTTAAAKGDPFASLVGPQFGGANSMAKPFAQAQSPSLAALGSAAPPTTGAFQASFGGGNSFAAFNAAAPPPLPARPASLMMPSSAPSPYYSMGVGGGAAFGAVPPGQTASRPPAPLAPGAPPFSSATAPSLPPRTAPYPDPRRGGW